MIESYQREPLADPALAGRILRALPPVSEAEPVIVRVRRADVDRGIARAIALASAGVLAQLELLIE